MFKRRCSLCGAKGRNMTNCPLNPYAINPNPSNHYHTSTEDGQISPHVTPSQSINNIKEAKLLNNQVESTKISHYPSINSGHYKRQYVIKSILGNGTYGEALLVKMTDTKQISVLKIEHNNEMSQSCLKEAIILHGLRHPAITSLKSVFPQDKKLVIELERMDSTLKPTSLSDFRHALESIAHGLLHMHLNGFAHNDLKPANILQRKSTIKIADFGLVTYRGLPRNKDGGYCAGTPLFVAPECTTDTDKNIDRTYTTLLGDTWSLGVIIYHYVYMQIYSKFPYEWFNSNAIYHINYSDDQDFPLGWKVKISRTNGEEYYIHTQAWITTFNPPLRVSQIKKSIGNDGFDLLKICMSRDPFNRPSMMEVLVHPFFNEQTFDLQIFDQQTAGAKRSQLSPLDNNNYQHNNITGDLKYLQYSKSYLKGIRYSIIVPKKHAIQSHTCKSLAKWFIMFSVSFNFNFETYMLAATMFTIHANNCYVSLDKQPSRTEIITLAIASLYLASCVLEEDVLTRKEMDRLGTSPRDVLSSVKFIVYSVINDRTFTLHPKLHLLTIYTLELKDEMLDEEYENFVNYTQNMALYMAFDGAPIDTQEVFCKTIVASTINDIKLNHKVWPWSDNMTDYNTYHGVVPINIKMK